MAHDFQLGVHLGQQNLTMDALRDTWRWLDEAGVDWISLWDHLYEAPPEGGTVDHFEAIAALGALCAETRNARIGCLVFYVGYRNLGVLAKAATTLDHLSGGRFELGIGAGWHAPEAKAFGYDFPRDGARLDMLAEAAPVIRSLLTEDRTTHDGEYFRLDDASCLPRPVQERLPIWIGGIGEKRTLRIVAENADGWNAAYVAPEEFGRLGGVLDEHCAAVDRDPTSIRRVINLTFNLVDDAAEAKAVEDRLRAQWGDDLLPRVQAGGLNGVPGPATVERILEYRAAGADGLNIALRAPWDDAALRRYVNEVIPAVRAAL